MTNSVLNASSQDCAWARAFDYMSYDVILYDRSVSVTIDNPFRRDQANAQADWYATNALKSYNRTQQFQNGHGETRSRE